MHIYILGVRGEPGLRTLRGLGGNHLSDTTYLPLLLLLLLLMIVLSLLLLVVVVVVVVRST